MLRPAVRSLRPALLCLALAGPGAGCDVNVRDFGRLDAGVGGDAGSDHGLPCDVDHVLATSCRSCHGAVPASSAPMSLVTLADLTKASTVDPAKSFAQRSLARMTDTASPMPPSPASPVDAAFVAAFAAWVNAGAPAGSCGGDGGVTDDPLNAAATCTSQSQGTNRESVNMTPGEACIACHSRGEGPSYRIAGTVFPSGHEPDGCNGASGAASAVRNVQIVIVDANHQTFTLNVNSPSGNFGYLGAVATPYSAKLVYDGKERVMVATQTSGDCNVCHTQDGAGTGGSAPAPGRITIPF